MKMKTKTGKHPGGRPTKYKPEYCQKIIDFFSNPKLMLNGNGKKVDELPFFFKFAESIGVDEDTVVEWAKVYPKFSAAYKNAKKLQEGCLVKNAITGNYNPTFSIFAAKNVCGWRDKTEVEHSGSLSLTQLLNAKREQDNQAGGSK